jgi:hypothetical protein
VNQTKRAPGHPRYLQLLDEMRDLHIRKDQDYAGEGMPFDNFRGASEIGQKPSIGAFIRLQDKFKRIQNLLKRESQGVGPAVADESIDDTLKDLSAYALIVLVLREEERGAAALTGERPREIVQVAIPRTGIFPIDTPEKLAAVLRPAPAKAEVSIDSTIRGRFGMSADSVAAKLTEIDRLCAEVDDLNEQLEIVRANSSQIVEENEKLRGEARAADKYWDRIKELEEALESVGWATRDGNHDAVKPFPRPPRAPGAEPVPVAMTAPLFRGIAAPQTVRPYQPGDCDPGDCHRSVNLNEQ